MGDEEEEGLVDGEERHLARHRRAVAVGQRDRDLGGGAGRPHRLRRRHRQRQRGIKALGHVEGHGVCGKHRRARIKPRRRRQCDVARHASVGANVRPQLVGGRHEEDEGVAAAVATSAQRQRQRVPPV